MVLPRGKRYVCRWLKDFSPAMIVLVCTLVYSVVSGDSFSVMNWQVVYRTLFRFFRFTLFLLLPLYLLLPICGFFARNMGRILLQTEKKQELRVRPSKHWVFRPFQGIGIGLLFETKLLAVLQVITGEPTKPFHFLPPDQFEPGRFLTITGITVVISLLLSTLWAFDDMGIRHVSEKDQEMKMIGKYAGTLMPIIFAFYGIFSLVASYPKVEAFLYLFKIVIVLYPPFLVFTVFHNHFLKRRREYFSRAVSLEAGGIWRSSPPST